MAALSKRLGAVVTENAVALISNNKNCTLPWIYLESTMKRPDFVVFSGTKE
jgi:hypothetical protein